MPSRVVSHAVPCMLGVFVCFKLRAGLEKKTFPNPTNLAVTMLAS